MPSRLALLFAMFGIACSLCAQDRQGPRHEVFGGYTFLSNSFNGVPGSRQPLNGWDGSFAFQPWHNLRFKAEAFGYRGSNLAAQQDGYFIMAGGQYGRRFGRESVFAEALGGEAGMNRYWGPNASPGESASFATLVGGGFDTPVSNHFSIRVTGDYLWENLALIVALNNTTPYRPAGLPNNFARISTGVVWRF